ncbi:MAG: hypothetical protein K8M05_10220 [Deltaproteobacteria bacterium]|nr:hypothetical protein [Kofleriaceae bacterium]
MKWLALTAAVVAVALLLLWREVRSSGASPAVAVAPTAAPAVPIARASADVVPARIAEPVDDDEPLPPHVLPAGVMAPEYDPGPIKKFSEPFWERVDETYSRRLLGFAADCYKGGKERKQKLKVAFRFNITGGKVSVTDVRPVESTLDDPALEACMLKAIAKATWDDKNMPDWTSSPDEEETIVVRISTLKRFGPETD